MAKQNTPSKAAQGADKAKTSTVPQIPKLTVFEEVGNLPTEEKSTEQPKEITEQDVMKALEDKARGEQISQEEDQAKKSPETPKVEPVFNMSGDVQPQMQGFDYNPVLTNVRETLSPDTNQEGQPVFNEDKLKERLKDLKNKSTEPSFDYDRLTKEPFKSFSSEAELLDNIAKNQEEVKESVKTKVSGLTNEEFDLAIEKLKTRPKTTLKTIEQDLAHNEENLLKVKKIVASEVLGKIRSGNYVSLIMPHKWLVHVINFPGVLFDQEVKTITYEGRTVKAIIGDVEDYVLTGEQQ